jgi:hypothetical protein
MARRPPTPIVVAALVLIASAGCRPASGPVEAYRAFAAAARAGDRDAAWGMLAERSRAVLDARAREAAARAPAGVVPASGKDLVLGDLTVTAPRLKSVTVVRESAEAAVIAAEEEGGAGAREVSLVREGGVWRVVLPFDK